ncbi:hypothetical protein G6M26_26950 [Agrobacterium tumefaciens]|nr:hypothetical protein [Agrobacterium tumefaciens]NTE22193.1 hypothetical protein [Agrobacterium tumefaciens]
MRFLNFLLLLLIVNIAELSAQEPMGALWEMTACENLPCEMLPVKKWVSQTVEPLFISGLQTSNSYWGDNNSISFSFTGKNSLSIALPNTNGIKLKFEDAYPPRLKSQKLRLIYTEQIKSYYVKRGYQNMPKTDEEYFNAAYDLLKVTPDAILANVLNFEIENKEGTTKLKTFLDRVNAKMKSNLTVPEKDLDNFSSFNSRYNDYFKENYIKVIYKTFIEQNSSKATMEKMNRFFAISRFFPNGIKTKVDDFFTPQFKLGMDKAESMLFPATIVSTAGAPNTPANFQYQNVQGKLDYLSKSLVLNFDGQFEHPVNLASAKIYDYAAAGTKTAFLKEKYSSKTYGNISKITLTVSDKALTVDALTDRDYRLLLSESKWKTDVPKNKIIKKK